MVEKAFSKVEIGYFRDFKRGQQDQRDLDDYFYDNQSNVCEVGYGIVCGNCGSQILNGVHCKSDFYNLYNITRCPSCGKRFFFKERKVN